jgi:hypothetical protein
MDHTVFHEWLINKQTNGEGKSSEKEGQDGQDERSEVENETTALLTVLRSLSPDDWSKTWPVDRTIMLRRTSKRVEEVVDN